MESPPGRLAQIDAALLEAPDSVELLYLRAGLLAGLGRGAEAKQGYLSVIQRAPGHFGALNDLGTLLYNANFRAAARTAYAEAVRRHPDNPIGLINLANALLANDEPEAARAHYAEALRLAPDDADARQGMANLLQAEGQGEAAEAHRQLSYRHRTLLTLPYRGAGPPLRVLLLTSAAGGNVPTQQLLDDRVFAVSVLAAEAHATADLPAHDLVFNAIGDADLCARALDAAEAILARTSAPVINPPAQVRVTGRAAIAGRLASIPGVRPPKVVLAARDQLARAAEAYRYPLLLRSPGFHAGRHFARVDGPSDLDRIADGLPGAELLLIEYLKTRDAKGQTRKYRVMVVDGRLYPSHLAISTDWKVHYFSADMADRPDHRAEERGFLNDMPGVLGRRAMDSLAGIGEALGLDYAGVDFGVGRDGEILLFEANATMVVNPPEPDPIWDYRRRPIGRILEAAGAMLVRRARGG